MRIPWRLREVYWWLHIRIRDLPARLRLGFWPHETWNLDVTIAKFVIPRLRFLRDTNCGHPTHMTEEKWKAIQDEIIWALEMVEDDSRWYNIPSVVKGDYKAIHNLSDNRQKGCILFGKYLQSFWS